MESRLFRQELSIKTQLGAYATLTANICAHHASMSRMTSLRPKSQVKAMIERQIRVKLRPVSKVFQMWPLIIGLQKSLIKIQVRAQEPTVFESLVTKQALEMIHIRLIWLTVPMLLSPCPRARLRLTNCHKSQTIPTRKSQSSTAQHHCKQSLTVTVGAVRMQTYETTWQKIESSQRETLEVTSAQERYKVTQIRARRVQVTLMQAGDNRRTSHR